MFWLRETSRLRCLRASFTNRSKILRSHFKLECGNLSPIDPKDIICVVIAVRPLRDRGRVVKARQHDLRECHQVRVFPSDIDGVVVVLRIEQRIGKQARVVERQLGTDGHSKSDGGWANRQQRSNVIVPLSISMDLSHLHRWVGSEDVVGTLKVGGEKVWQQKGTIEALAGQYTQTL